jgi:hypothetical protein
MNKYKREEVLPKIKPNQMDGEHHAAAGASEQGETRRSRQVRVATDNLRTMRYTLPWKKKR